MYCSNCGMKLPDWANYCERCGARVRHAKASDDPIDQVGKDDTSAMEPLWAEDAERREEDKPSRLPQAEPGMLTELVGTDTVLMDADEFEGGRETLEESEPAPAVEGKAGASEHPDLTQSVDPAAMAEVAREGVEESERASEASLPQQDEGQAPRPDDAELPDAGREQATRRPRRIDVGEMDGMLPVDSTAHRRAPEEWHNRYNTFERRREESAMSMKMLAIAAASALALGLLVAFILMGTRGSFGGGGNAPSALMEGVSKAKADEVIASLNGWWTTDRTFDGRYWHMQDGLMETYAADGQLAKQVLIDNTAVKRMASGPGGIEGAGYYLRDIAFYLLDADQNTLHAINGDGSAEESANLFRSEAPAFINNGKKTDGKDTWTPDTTVDDSEYILPESSTRVYTTAELEKLSDHDLFVARNEIYARHGYLFETGELSEYFFSKSWYHPSNVFNEGEINDIERQNVSSILAIEQARGSQYV